MSSPVFETQIRFTPTRLLRGRKRGWPTTCDHPTCRGPLIKMHLRVKQANRRWAFCTAECLSRYIVLASLPVVHEDDMIDMFDTGSI